MTSRASLVRSIPFWVLLVASLALTGIGAWLVLSRLAAMEEAIVNQSAEATIAVYVGGPAITAAATILGAGIIGLLLTLTVAALATLRPQPAAEVVEAIDWTNDDQTVAETFSPVDTDTRRSTDAAPVASAPLASDPVVVSEPTAAGDPVIDERAAAGDPVTDDEPKTKPAQS